LPGIQGGGETAWHNQERTGPLRQRRRTKSLDEQSAESEVDQFTGIKLEIGSDLEIARLCINDMFANDGRYVFSEGAFYHWTGRIWAELSDVDVQKRFVSRYDGARYGGSGVIRLDQHKAKSIIKFIAQEMEIGDYFQDRPLGVNCQNGFVIFDKDGNVSLIEHHPASPRALSRAACALAVS
jgi:hypothetical protein